MANKKTTGDSSKLKSMFGKISTNDILNILFGASTLKDFANTTEGKKVAEKISGKIFGIGAGDEALKIKAFDYYIEKILELNLSDLKDEQEIVKLKKKFNGFFEYLKEEGYSTLWLRNVLATMRPGDKEGENQAAREIAKIMMGKTFSEMVELADPDSIRITYLKKLSRGWEFVVNKSGKLDLLVDIPKFEKFVPSPKKMKEKAKADFFKFTKVFWSGVGAVIAIVLLRELILLVIN